MAETPRVIEVPKVTVKIENVRTKATVERIINGLDKQGIQDLLVWGAALWGKGWDLHEFNVVSIEEVNKRVIVDIAKANEQ